MKELLEHIAKSIVDNPDTVEITESRSGRGVTYYLTVSPEDMGRVIGKQGKMANAIRTLLRVAAVKSGEQVSLEIGK